jgi:glycosyltransferase involved in cell wall biosynthesis
MNPRRIFGLGVKLNHYLAQWGADLIIAVSNFTASYWRGAGVRIQVIHNVAPVIYDQVSEPATHPIHCVIAGHLTEDKGHHLAIQAVLSARAQGHDVRLDIFGGPLESNPYFDRLKQIVKQSHQQEYIRFMGFRPDLRQHHQSYNIGLQCRIGPEPCSVWVCETLLDGLPLVAADSGGTPELIEDGLTGLLFRSGDVEDLTSKLIKLVVDPSGLKAMRHHACARGQRLFRLDRFISQTSEAYTSVIPSSPETGV